MTTAKIVRAEIRAITKRISNLARLNKLLKIGIFAFAIFIIIIEIVSSPEYFLQDIFIPFIMLMFLIVNLYHRTKEKEDIERFKKELRKLL